MKDVKIGYAVSTKIVSFIANANVICLGPRKIARNNEIGPRYYL